MPDQNPADPTAPGPVASFSNLGAASEPPPLPSMDSSDLPPAPPIVEPAPPETPAVGDTGGAAPTFDISSSISGTPPPKKKFGGRRFVATILGLLVLVGGLGAGIILVQQQQDIRERASIPAEPGGGGGTPTLTPTATRVPTPPTATPTQTPSPTSSQSNLCPRDCVTPKSKCAAGSFYPDEAHALAYGDCGGIGSNEYCCNLAAGTGTPTPTPTSTSSGGSCTIVKRDPNSQGYCDRSAPNTQNCTDKNEGSSCTITAQCGGGSGTCVVINQGGANSECQCQKGGGGGGTPTPTPTVTQRPGGGVTAQCFNVRAFDASWNELTTTQLSALKAGDKVRFTIGGNTSSGSFDKAKFKINGVERPEVTGKKPSSQDFFDEYTIPANTTTFTINAKIHHTSLGWSK